MNICFISGKVINEIDLKFIYKNKTKSLGKQNISVVEILLELEDNQIIKLKAYNEKADWIFQNIRRNDYIIIKGTVAVEYIEIEELEIM